MTSGSHTNVIVSYLSESTPGLSVPCSEQPLCQTLRQGFGDNKIFHFLSGITCLSVLLLVVQASPVAELFIMSHQVLLLPRLLLSDMGVTLVR